MTKVLGVGIIGCGNISTSYLNFAPLFKGIEMRACADINPDAAKARAAEYGIRASSVEELLAADDIDLVVNLTVPAVPYAVSAQALDAGKHPRGGRLGHGKLLRRQGQLAGFVNQLDQPKVLDLQVSGCGRHKTHINFVMQIVNQFI